MNKFELVKCGLEESRKNDTEKVFKSMITWCEYTIKCGKLPESQENSLKTLISTIKLIDLCNKYLGGTKQMKNYDLEHMYGLMIRMLFTLEETTLCQFIQAFPISKRYEGEKNYFTTMELIRSKNLEQPVYNISERCDSLDFATCHQEKVPFLTDYQNEEIQNMLAICKNTRDEMYRRNLINLWWDRMLQLYRYKKFDWEMIKGKGVS